VDIVKVTAVDAAGLGLLVEAHTWADQNGRRILFANPTRTIQRLLQITNLDGVLAVCTTGNFEPTDTRASGPSVNMLCGCVA
jgi:anti-anti-sigma factor